MTFKTGDKVVVDYPPGCEAEGKWHGIWPAINGQEAEILPYVAPTHDDHTIRAMVLGHWQYFKPDELRYTEPVD